MEIPLSSDELKLKLKNEKYFKALLIQIDKDFNDLDFTVSLQALSIDQSEYFFELISDFIRKKYQENASDFFQLLYLIDIPEKLIAPFFEGNSTKWKELAYLISKREFLKIILREKYSKV